MPSGASTGEREALELRDGDKTRYLGKGVRKAVAQHQRRDRRRAPRRRHSTSARIDRRSIELDGTPTKSRLGANALLGVSMAAARAAAAAAGRPLYAAPRRNSAGDPAAGDTLLPVPMMNILNGGAHADSSVDLQEFMVMPVGMPTFAEALRAGTEIFHALRGILKKAGHSTGVGDEGGFAPNLKSNREALDLVLEAIGKAGLQAGDGCLPRARRRRERAVGQRQVRVQKSGEPTRTPEQMVELYVDWVRQYPIISIEDGVAEGDWDGLEGADARARRPRAARRRRCVRHQSGDPAQGHRRRRRQRAARQAESDRHRVGNARRDRASPARPATRRSFRTVRAKPKTAPSPTSRSAPRPGQIKTGSASRSDRDREVQPAAAHRRRARLVGALRRPVGHPPAGLV